MTSYRPGEHVHPIQARLTGETPWGWRPGTVRCCHDGITVVDYLLEPGTITLWHHRPLDLAPGTPVRVHEQYYLWEVGPAWLSYERRAGGLGAVPAPEHPELWAGEMSVPITAVATGIAYRGEVDDLR